MHKTEVQSVENQPDQRKISRETLGEANRLCENEPYRNQPTAGFCSGFLVGEDLFVTAGHCIPNQAKCDSIAIVFDYMFSSTNKSPEIAAVHNIYSCKEIIKQALSNDSQDFAVIRLKTKVTDRAPLLLNRSGKIALDTEVVVIGNPAGLPTKVAGGAKVRKNDNDAFFQANLDTYGGNSGSAVFNQTTGLVEGILVRGEFDWDTDAQNNCTRSKKCENDGCRGEDVTRISNVLSVIP